MTDRNHFIDNVKMSIDILNEHGVLSSATPLYSLIESIKRYNEADSLTCSLIGLEFTPSCLSKNQFIKADEWEASSFIVKLDMKLVLVANSCFEFGSVTDHIVEISYEASSEVTCDLSRGAWHLDYHKDEDNASPPQYIHPSYHFHHGGRRVKDNIGSYGDLILLDAPRLMHPPLDLFLAIDFLISNFTLDRIWKNIRADTRYQKIIKNSQDKWWKGYYQQISDYWIHQSSGKEDTQKRASANLSIPYLYI
ncbi:hypothetical protein MMK73_000859 [Providencia rettgeri]|uniref:hypothetical protein n=1 Tax=Providencia TaxID=586 RepID=UPI0012B5147D|nr:MULTISPECIES: hypothetical protein [Providencia]ELR5229995.1 hypothetical protein [Providencia rettgeri]MTC50073.1 hypothetical protein [Providencia alcalifaciens]